MRLLGMGCLKLCEPEDNSTGKSKISDKMKRHGIRASAFDIKNEMEITKYPKSKYDSDIIKRAITSSEFLSNVFEADQLDIIVDAMYLKELYPNEVIIREGEEGNFMCVSGGGCFQVLDNDLMANEFSDYRVFGEHAILYNIERNATIKCATHCRVWNLDRTVLQHIIIRDALKERDEFFSFLKKVPILNSASDDKLKGAANLLKREFFKTNNIIVNQGDPGDKFYVIRAGHVTITKEYEGDVSVLARGEFFGEKALLQEITRQATVTANAPGVECLTLHRNEFIEHFGEIEEFVQESKARTSEISLDCAEYEQTNIEDLNYVTSLGEGGFGRVDLMVHKNNPKMTFALKHLKKVNIIQNNHEQQVLREKNVHISCNSLFIVRLYKTYRDNKYVYFLLEPCLGGDLFSLIQRQKKKSFDEASARFYAACTLEALAYLHARNFVYRDLKPENLMLSTRGYVKLIDLGLIIKIDNHEKTFTFVGTPEYMAPEMIKQRGYDKAVDYWAFGIFVYELLVGKSPFRCKDQNQLKIYTSILKGIDKVVFPKHVSNAAQNLIKKLCQNRPMDRLGCQRNGIADIKGHKWFQEFNWDKLKQQKITPPFVPKLKSNTDTRYFPTVKKDIEIPRDEISGWDEEF